MLLVLDMGNTNITMGAYEGEKLLFAVALGDTGVNLEYMRMLARLRREPELLKGCTAVVCYNDQVAYPLMDLLLTKHIAVPEQMAVVSFDNSFYSNLSTCRITSLSHGNYNVGRIAAEALMELLEGRQAHSQTVPWVLMEKESS